VSRFRFTGLFGTGLAGASAGTVRADREQGMRFLVLVVAALCALPSVADAHGCCYRGPVDGPPPNSGPPGDPPPPPFAARPWSDWWSANKEEILYPGSAVRQVEPEPDTAPSGRRLIAEAILPSLEQVLDDPRGLSLADRARLLVALGCLGVQEADLRERVGPRLRLVAAGGDDARLRFAAMLGLALARDRSPETAELLAALLADPREDASVSGVAAVALGLLRFVPGDEGYEPVATALRSAAAGDAREPVVSCAFLGMGLARDVAFLPDLLAGARARQTHALLGLAKLAEVRTEAVCDATVDAIERVLRVRDNDLFRCGLVAAGIVASRPGLDEARAGRLAGIVDRAAASGPERERMTALVSQGRIAGGSEHRQVRRFAVRSLVASLSKSPDGAYAALGLGLAGRHPALEPWEWGGIRDCLREAFLADGTPDAVRSACALALGMVGDPWSAGELRAALEAAGGKEKLRGMCAMALAMLGGAGAARDVGGTVEGGLAGNDLVLAATAAGVLRDDRSAPALLARLEAAKPGDLGLLVQALGKTRDPRAVEPLLGILRDGGAPSSDRGAAAVALADLYDGDGTLVLSRLTKDLDPDLLAPPIRRLLALL
jgi:HEAT repeat protein